MRIRGGRAWAIAVCGPALASIGGCVNAPMTPTQMDALQVRVNRKCEAVALAGLGPLAHVGVAVAHPGHRAEMLGHDCKGSFAISNGFVKAFGKVISNGALVIGLRELCIFLHGLREFF